jgi:hypothetical protein
MKLKKLSSVSALIIACVMLLAFAAGCNGDDTPAPAVPDSVPADTPDPAPSGDPTAPDDPAPSDEPAPSDDPEPAPAAAVSVPMQLPAGGMYLPDPLNSNVFTAVEGDGFLDYNFKNSGGAWVNIMNPWGDSAFLVFEPSNGFVQSMIVIFSVEGYDGGSDGYRAMPGFAINGFSPSLWSLDEGMDDGLNWEEVFGGKYNFVIDGDGVYQMIISFRAAMDYFEEHNDWYIKDFVESIDCIELGIYGVPEGTTMKVTILGIEETADIFSFENIQRPLGSDAFFAASIDALPALPATEAPHEPRVGEDDE